MTTFDEREKAYEKKFALDQDLKFKAESRRNRMLAEWAGAKLGITGPALDEYIKAVRKADRPVLASWIGEQDARDARSLLAAAQIPSYETPEQAVRGFMHLVRYRRNQEILIQTPPSVPEQFTVDLPGARAAVAAALGEGRSLLQGPEAQAILKAFAIPTVESIVATNGAEALAGSNPSARRMNGRRAPASVPQVTTPTRLSATVSATST